MNQPNEGMRERYKEFNYHNDNEGGGRFVRFDEDMLISFIDQEIDLALAKQRSQIVEIINSLEDSIEKNLYGYDCFPGSPQQAKDTISIIISTINKQQHDK